MILNIEAIKNLEQNKAVSSSIKDYANDMMLLTYHAGIVLTGMNVYGIYEQLIDDECEIDKEIEDFFAEICNVLSRTILKRCRGIEYDAGIGLFMQLRQRIIEKAEKYEDNEDMLDKYVSLMELINPAFATFLVSKEVKNGDKELKPCKELISFIVESYNGKVEFSDEKAVSFLVSMEGLQERYYSTLYKYQLPFLDIYKGFSEEILKKKLNKQYDSLLKTSRLLSSSPFAPLI